MRCIIADCIIEIGYYIKLTHAFYYINSMYHIIRTKEKSQYNFVIINLLSIYNNFCLLIIVQYTEWSQFFPKYYFVST